MKKKIIITSALTAALMLAGAVGGTFAWFTSEAKTDVNITAGKVNISSVVSELKTYSLGVEQAAGKFENGGTALLEGQTITLDKMTPGDKVTFKIKVTNNSDVKIKYRVAFRKTGALGSALVGGATGGASGWTPLEVGSQDIDLSASIELPENTGNEYQGKTGQVTVLVEAIQDNGVKAVANVADFEKAINDIPAEGGNVSLYLSEDITLSKVLAIPSNANITIYGDGDTKIKSASGKDRIINFDSAKNSTLTLSNVELDGPTSGSYTRGISMYGSEDCTVNLDNVTLNQPDYYAINVASENKNATINIENSNLQGWGVLNVWSPNTTINIKDSTLAGINNHSGTSNAFALFIFNAEAGEGHNSTGSKISLDNCVVNAIQNGDQYEAFYSIRTSNIAVESTNTVYNYTRQGASQPESYASIEEVVDYSSICWINEAGSYKVEPRAVAYGGQAAKEYPLFEAYSGDDIVDNDIDTSAYLNGAMTAARQQQLNAAGYVTSDSTVNNKPFLMTYVEE